MASLTHTERELVAIGAALGSNCVPCIEYHVPEARKAGLTDRQIGEAVRLADQVRQVPARKVLAAAEGLLVETGVPNPGAQGPCAGEQPQPAQHADPVSPCCG